MPHLDETNDGTSDGFPDFEVENPKNTAIPKDRMHFAQIVKENYLTMDSCFGKILLCSCTCNVRFHRSTLVILVFTV